jgi:hypothetical protein
VLFKANYDNSYFKNFCHILSVVKSFYFLFDCRAVRPTMTFYNLYYLFFIITYFIPYVLMWMGFGSPLTRIFFKPFGNPIDTFSLGFPYHHSLIYLIFECCWVVYISIYFISKTMFFIEVLHLLQHRLFHLFLLHN